MAAEFPQVPFNADPEDPAWRWFFKKLKQFFETDLGGVPWAVVDKTGSNLTDIVTRNHNDLQNMQGGTSGEYYHLTSAMYSVLTGGALGNNLVLYTNASGAISTEAGFSYDEATNELVVPSITVSDLTTARFAIVSTSGALTSSASFTYLDDPAGSGITFYISGTSANTIQFRMANSGVGGCQFLFSAASGGTSGGNYYAVDQDTYVLFTGATAGYTWHTGLDYDDTGALSFGYSASVGTNTVLKLTQSGTAIITGNTRVGAATAPTVALDVTGTVQTSGGLVLGIASSGITGSSDNYFPHIIGRQSAYTTSLANPTLYVSGTSAGSHPFNQFGHLILQLDVVSGSSRDFVIASEISSTVAQRFRVTGSTGAVQLSNATSLNITEDTGRLAALGLRLQATTASTAGLAIMPKSTGTALVRIYNVDEATGTNVGWANLYVDPATPTQLVVSGSSAGTGTAVSTFYVNMGVDTASYYSMSAATPATTGAIRLPNNYYIRWRNAANTTNYGIALNASNVFETDTSFQTAGVMIVVNGGTVANAGAVRLSNNNAIRWRDFGNTTNYGMYLSTSDILVVDVAAHFSSSNPSYITGSLRIGSAVAPSYKLDVTSSTAADGVRFTSSVNSTMGGFILNNDTGSSWSVIVARSGAANAGTAVYTAASGHAFANDVTIGASTMGTTALTLTGDFAFTNAAGVIANTVVNLNSITNTYNSGGSSTAARSLLLSQTLGGATQFLTAEGIVSSTVYASSATISAIRSLHTYLTTSSTGTITLAIGHSSQITTNSACTITSAAGFWVYGAALGGGGSITNWYGTYVSDPGTAAGSVAYGHHITDFTAATTRTAAVSSAMTSGTGKWGLYFSGSANNALTGSLRIGSTATPTYALDVIGDMAITSKGVIGSNTISGSAQLYVFADLTSTSSGEYSVFAQARANNASGSNGKYAGYFQAYYGASSTGTSPLYGVLAFITFPQAITSSVSHSGFASSSDVQVAGATVSGGIAAYSANGLTNTGGGTVSGATWTGFAANNCTLTLAATYGFWTNMTSGTGKYGFAATGTAQNYFVGVTGIGNTPSSSSGLTLGASTTTVSSLRIPHGSAPTSPVDGDMWTTTAGLYVRINGSTVGPLT